MVNKKKISGVYQIRNLVTDELYIGSSVNLSQRKRSHIYRLDKNVHFNQHLQNSYNKHGKESFVFEILLICEIFELVYYEQKLIDIFKPVYNKRMIAESNRGRKLSQETKLKMSLSAKGKPKSEETKRRMSLSDHSNAGLHKGGHLSEDHKNKLSIAHKGRKTSQDTRNKLSESITKWWKERKNVS